LIGIDADGGDRGVGRCDGSSVVLTQEAAHEADAFLAADVVGVKGEVWDLFPDLPKMMRACGAWVRTSFTIRRTL
jgi:hypothetical protein